MDYSESYSSRYSMWSVDPTTWLDVREVMELQDLKVEADHGDAQIESASATVGAMDDLLWVRIYLERSYEGKHDRTAVFTGRVSAPARSINGTESRWPLTIASVLSPCATVYPDDGDGMYGDVATEVMRLISAYTPAPITNRAAQHVLSETIVAEQEWTVLDLVRQGLDATDGLRVRIDGMGRIEVTDDDRPVATLDTVLNDVVMPEMTDRSERDGRPNVYVAVMDGTSARWSDEMDIEARGIVMVKDTDVTLVGDETLGEYARRKGMEAQSVARTVSYEREYDPDIRVGDVIELDLPGQGIQGLFRVMSQSTDHEAGGIVDEEVTEVAA